MHIHLSDSLTHEQETKDYTAELEFDVFENGLADYPVIDKKPVKLRVTNTGDKKLLIEADVSFALVMPCDRCLEAVTVPFSFPISRMADFREGKEESEEPEEQPYIEGYTLDVDALVRDELFVHMPMKVLCREDCKGICNRCGANLNHGVCGCEVTEQDPRMAVIRDIFRDANQ
ncbi:YceD family protein [Qiania dongpingensis]|uniref:DUF177 domain-containing protein n=1 Tax=Qiania dongpingensis TaxID=2763669 RepID=A0A7G9G526_9FIRM|nr:DUF177 domain-containing protein [Qiania dongpingensis]QNM05908.1 DUF177 domain-containing protein [Qiania dongpingensis]